MASSWALPHISSMIVFFIVVFVISELQCTGPTVTLTVTDGLTQTFVNGSEVTDSCLLHHVCILCLSLS